MLYCKDQMQDRQLLIEKKIVAKQLCCMSTAFRLTSLHRHLVKRKKKFMNGLQTHILISLEEALHRVKRESYLPYSGSSQKLVTTSDEEDAIKELTKEFRNEFEHFFPKRWAAVTSKFPQIVGNVLRVIQFLVFESNCVNMSVEQDKRAKVAIENVSRLLKP